LQNKIFGLIEGCGWMPGAMNPEKKRIEELCVPVYGWMKTLE
jgi:hypothetical protein